jgi:hypothetical protein
MAAGSGNSIADLAAKYESGPAVRRIGTENGVALMMAVLACLLLSAMAAALILLSSSETIIAGHFRNSIEARFAAEAMMARGIDLASNDGDWTASIAGLKPPAWTDGALAGPRRLADGTNLDLAQAVNLANCQKTVPCAAQDLAAVSVDRPWGSNNPTWRPYAYGPLSDMLAAGTIDSSYYALLLIADDPAGSHRAAGAPVPPREGIALRVEAFGPHGTHAVAEVMAERVVVGAEGEEKDYNAGSGPLPMKILSWREVR